MNAIGVEVDKALLPKGPFEDASFDLVSSFSVCEHLPSMAVLRASIRECHRVCGKGVIFSVPFECMHPWRNMEHNFDFTKEKILGLTESLFRLKSWEVLKDGDSTRSLRYFEKIGGSTTGERVFRNGQKRWLLPPQTNRWLAS